MLSFLSVLFLSVMTQKQIAASNKIQVKAATPNVMAVITVVIVLRVLNLILLILKCLCERV